MEVQCNKPVDIDSGWPTLRSFDMRSSSQGNPKNYELKMRMVEKHKVKSDRPKCLHIWHMNRTPDILISATEAKK